MSEFLTDTNLLIYHTAGFTQSMKFLERMIQEGSFNISIITKIEFLGWDKHTEEGIEKCRQLISLARIIPLDNAIADKAIELKKKTNIKLADAVIAATALVNNLNLATRNKEDFKDVEGLEVRDPFSKN